MSGQGVVKGVYGGDWVVIQGAPGADGIAPEKKIYFSSISAPRLNQGDAFAWEARCFLKNKVLGKSVSFKMEYKANNLEYGFIMCGGENIIQSIVAEGYARVLNQKEGSRSGFYDELKEVEKVAKDAEKNIWATDAATRDAATRHITRVGSEGYSVTGILKDPKYKGRIPALIEDVFNGSSYNAILLTDFTQIKVNLPNVQSPSLNSANELQKKVGGQARGFVERLLLHQQIEINLISCDEKYNSFVADVIHPKGNIVMELLKRGFAQYLHPSGTFNRDYFATLHQAQTTAQENKIGIWQEFTKAKSTISADEATFSGKIMEVHSGDSLTVLSDKGNLKRLFLASLRAPRFGKPHSDEQDEPYAFEAKEYVRKHAIGKKVRVEMEFTRTVGTEVKKTLEFASIIFSQGNKNLAEMIAKSGLSKAEAPRYNEEGSRYITDLLAAQDNAKTKKEGIWSGKSSPSHRLQDLVGPQNTKKSKEYEMYFTDENGKKLKGVIEHVFNGGRYKVRVPKHNCYVGIILHGVKCPVADKNDAESVRTLAEELTKHAKENFHQRDIEVEVDFCDNKGNYFGSIFQGKKNVGTTLLEMGYASVSSFGNREVRHLAEYKSAETEARSTKKGIWGSGGAIMSATSSSTVSKKLITGELSEIVDASLFYVHDSQDNHLDEINEKLASFNESGNKLEPPVKKGTLCVAKFSVDEAWYRGVVEKTLGGGEYQVRFADYGNSEKMSVEDMRKISKDHLKHPFQAQKCQLAYLSVPRATESEDDVGAHAAFFLRELAWGQALKAKVVAKDATGCLDVVLLTSNGKDNLNIKMLENGHAKFDRSAARELEDFADWDNAEMMAKQKSIGVWEGGAFSDDEDEDED